MAKEAAVIIIKKKKKGGHAAGHHGGAWKVAYADFVTAMMAFFLVMWAMGFDEQTKASIVNYFNNPSSPWTPQLSEKDSLPMGDRTGAGESILHGLEGGVPENQLMIPARPINENPNGGDSNRSTGFAADALEVLSKTTEMNFESIRFSIPTKNLFVLGSTNFQPAAKKLLTQLSLAARGNKGILNIQTDLDLRPGANTEKGSEKSQDPYELSLARSVAVLQYLVANKIMNEERIKAGALEKIQRSPAAQAYSMEAIEVPEPKVLFTLGKTAQATE
ncbi:flagellar motor protein MotB [Bdellovibrionota bacterium FG-2]